MAGVPASAAVEAVRGRVRRLPLPHRPQDHHHLHGRRLVRPHRPRQVGTGEPILLNIFNIK
jgi:hypothetical protein